MPLEISSEEFHKLVDYVAQLAGDYLQTIDSRSTFPGVSGTEVERLFRRPLDEKGLGQNAFSHLRHVIENSRVQNARFFGYVLGSGESVGAVADLLASVLNQNVTAWRSGPAAVTIEHTVIDWIATAIGCNGFRGSLTGGGSPANLMGLAMAREAKLPSNESGIGNREAVVYASTEVHMSIPKAAALLGIGRRNLHLIATDSNFRMIPSELESAIQRDKATGKIPIAVVATAGTVNTGAIDPLNQISAIAKKHALWMHVDGAYGALAAIAAPEKFVGLNLADSLSLDPHKWLYQPLDSGCLLYRDPAPARAAFSHSGDYAKVLTSDPIEGFAFFEESMELSRRFRALRLWLSLRYHGLRAFRECIGKNIALAQRLASQISNHVELELMAPTDLSAICFRHKADTDLNDHDLNHHNAELLTKIVRRGRVYLSNAVLHGRFCLRACVVNHRTNESDVDAVISEVITAARETSA